MKIDKTSAITLAMSFGVIYDACRQVIANVPENAPTIVFNALTTGVENASKREDVGDEVAEG